MSCLAIWTPGPIELVVIAVVALLIFGRRLPDVARSVGKSIIEFKRGMKDVKDDMDQQSRLESPPKSPALGSAPNSNAGTTPNSTADTTPAQPANHTQEQPADRSN